MTDPTNSRKLQLEPTVDATAVRPGVEATKQAIGEIGQAAQKAGEAGSQGLAKMGAAGKKAGEDAAGGLDKIPQSTDKAAKKVEADTRNMIGSIERATAAFKAGQRGSADYFEELAKQRGISGDAIKPYVDQLRAAEAAQKAAGKSLGTMEISAKQTAAALRGVPAQLTDIVTSLQGGQQPLTVFLQQGGQLRDMFGSAGAAAKALGSAVLGLVTPLTVSAALVAGLGIAYNKGSEEGLAFNRTLILTGNQAGATADQLMRAAAGIKSFEITQGAAADTINQLAATGKVGEENLGRFAAAAIRLEQVGGPAVEETVKAFAELGKSPLQAALKLNETTNFLTASIYEQIRAQEQQGRTVEAARVAQEAFAAETERRIPRLAENVGALERAWLGVKKVISGIGDDLANIGRADTIASLEKQLRNAEIRSREAGPAGLMAVWAENNVKALREQLAALKEVEALAKRSALADAERARQLAALAEFDKLAEQNLDKQAKLKLEILRIENLGVAAGKSRKEIEEQIAVARAKAADKVSTAGVDNELAGIKAKIAAAEQYGRALQAQGVKAKELNEGERLAAKLREDLNGKLSAAARATKEIALGEAERLAGVLKGNSVEEQRLKLIEKSRAELDKQTGALSDQAAAIERQAAQQEAANAVFGRGKTAIEDMTLAELRKQAVDLEATDNHDPKYLASLYAKIAAQERYAKALQAADFKQLNQGLDEWMRSATEQQRLFEGELQLAGLTRVEREKVVAVRKVELELAKRLSDIDKSNLTDAEKEVLRIKARAAAATESSAAVAKVVRDDWNRTADQIEQSLTDALMRGFESGRSFGESLRDSIVAMFKTMVLRPVIQAVVQPVAGAITSVVGGTVGGSSPGGTGQLGTAVNLYGAGKNLWSAGSSLYTVGSQYYAGTMSGANAAGTLYANATGTGLDGLLAYNGAYGTAAGAAGSGAGGAAAGSAGGSSFTWGGAGVYAAIVAVIANALGLFKNTKTVGGGITGMLGEGDIQNFVVNRKSGSLFSGPSYSTPTVGVAAQSDAIQKAYEALRTKAVDFAEILGVGTSAIANFTVALGSEKLSDDTGGIGIRLEGLTGEEAAAKVQAALVSANDSLARAVLGSYADTFKKEGETASATLGRLAGGLEAVNATLAALGQTAIDSSLVGADAASKLQDAFGGLQNFQSLSSQYFDAYYSEAERSALVTAGLTKSFADLNIQMPASREAYRALVEEQAKSLGTEAGREAYAALLQLAPVFASVVAATDTLGGSADQTAEQIAQAAEKMAEAGRKVLADLADQQGALQVDLLRAQGDAAGAAALERQRALAKLTEGLSTQDAAAATAAYDLAAATREQISALDAAASAAQQAAAAEAQRTAAIEQQRAALQDQLDQALGNVGALRERQLAALDDPVSRARQQQLFEIQDQQAEQQRLAAVAKERFDIESQLLQLMGDTAALRARELEALDPVNRETKQRYYALLDEQEASRLATQAAQESAAAQQQAAAAEAQRVASIAGERENLITRLLQAQGDTAALRERELAALDPSNREYLERIHRIEDEKVAQQEAAQAAQQAAQAAQQAAQAAEQLRQAWQGTTDSIYAQIDRIRGLDSATSPTSLADAQARLAITQAQARAGDQDAAKLLPQLSEAMLAIAQAQFTSAVDLRLLRAQTAASLTVTAEQLAGRFGLAVPRMATGTNEVPQDMLAVVHRGEAIVPKAFNPALAGGQREDRLLAVMEGMRADLRVQAATIVRVQSDLLKLQKKWDYTGTPPVRKEGVTA